MCQHYEHCAAESTIDLDSPPHGCRVPGGNLLLLRCDKRNEAPTSPKETNQYLPEAGKAEPLSLAPGTGRSAPSAQQHCQLHSALRPERSIVGRISSLPWTSPECPRPDSNRQPAD